jgi:hypothetical protein
VRVAALVTVLATAVGGCGWRTGLDEGLGPLDGGPPPLGDAGIDAALDGMPDAPDPPVWELLCPEEVLEGPARQPQTITAAVLPEDVDLVLMRWQVTERPDGSTARATPRDALTTELTPDEAGDYVLELTATDAFGTVQSCEVLVVALPTGPQVSCPGTVEAAPLDTVTLEAQVTGDRPIVSYHWEVTRRPDGAANREPSPQDARVTEFRTDVAGEYVLRFTATDDAGEAASCSVRVLALSTQGLRVEIYWNPPDSSCLRWPEPCDRTDVDVHLLRPGNEPWFHNTGDCYFANCTPSRPPLRWGSPGLEDNPRLDIDIVRGFGPENINIDEPYPGTYRVGVHFYDGHGQNTADVVVNVYCGGDLIEPHRTFGPVRLRDRPGGWTANDFWTVADVEIRAGEPCRVTDLARPNGQPRIITADESTRTR